MASYIVINGPQPTTAASPSVTTGTAIKTMLQVVPSAPIQIVEWGWSGDATAAAAPGKVELLTTGTVAATVTAYAAADVMPYDDPTAAANTAGTTGVPLNLGTALSGYTATAEGTITATRILDMQLIEGMNQYDKMWPLGERPGVKGGDVLRIRNTFAAAVNVYCWLIFRPL